jgi:GDP-4-dehydro-6-deoxy-D-mannose reductase
VPRAPTASHGDRDVGVSHAVSSSMAGGCVRALVTGAAGFVGQWLTRALRENGMAITGVALAPHGPVTAGDDGVQWLFGDLRDDAVVARVVEATTPDVVVHLAAISHLPTAAADPAAAWDVNVTATARLLHHLDRVRTVGTADPTVLLVGSAEQYGRQPTGAQPIREDAPQLPRTVYAATKAAQELLGLQMWRASGLRVIAARSFNHSGRGQESRFLLPALVGRALALRDASQGTPLMVGNTTPIRDFLHVSDVVSAYISLLHHGTPGESYNVASGIGRSVQDTVAHVLSRVGVDAPVTPDPALVRPVDVPALVGDPHKLQQATGWRATRTFDDIIDDLIHAATY